MTENPASWAIWKKFIQPWKSYLSSVLIYSVLPWRPQRLYSHAATLLYRHSHSLTAKALTNTGLHQKTGHQLLWVKKLLLYSCWQVCRNIADRCSKFCHSETRNSDGVLRHVSCLQTVSRHGCSCLGLGSVSTLVCLVLVRVSSFHVSSCLMSHNVSL